MTVLAGRLVSLYSAMLSPTPYNRRCHRKQDFITETFHPNDFVIINYTERIQRTMTKGEIQKPRLEERGIERKRIYNGTLFLKINTRKKPSKLSG